MGKFRVRVSYVDDDGLESPVGTDIEVSEEAKLINVTVDVLDEIEKPVRQNYTHRRPSKIT